LAATINLQRNVVASSRIAGSPALKFFDIRFAPESDRLLHNSENDALCDYRLKCTAAKCANSISLSAVA
jgi:hypothetical protein